MRGLVPRIHAFCAGGKTWMAGTSPAMTPSLWLDVSETRSNLHRARVKQRELAYDGGDGSRRDRIDARRDIGV